MKKFLYPRFFIHTVGFLKFNFKYINLNFTNFKLFKKNFLICIFFFSCNFKFQKEENDIRKMISTIDIQSQNIKILNFLLIDILSEIDGKVIFLNKPIFKSINDYWTDETLINYSNFRSNFIKLKEEILSLNEKIIFSKTQVNSLFDDLKWDYLDKYEFEKFLIDENKIISQNTLFINKLSIKLDSTILNFKKMDNKLDGIFIQINNSQYK